MNKFAVTALAFAMTATPLAAQMQMHGSSMHGDHNPHNGGAVNMYGMIHYEIVVPPAGGVRVYITDEMRNDLPATAVSNLKAEIVRPGGAIEPVRMAISPTGEFWAGRSKPVTNPKSVVRIAFMLQGERVLVEMDGETFPDLMKAKSGKKSAGMKSMGTKSAGAMPGMMKAAGKTNGD
jgi:hypothetical protein